MLRQITNKMMRAIYVNKFGTEEVLALNDKVAIPSLGDTEVSIKVKYSCVNPVDTYIRGGAYAVLPTLPYVPGKDGSGIVDSVGAKVSKVKVGDRVFCSDNVRFGTLGEYTIVNESKVFPLDSKLSFEKGSAIGIPYFTAYHALFHRAKAQKGDRILIHGASGAVGLAATQIAKAHGMTIVGTASTQEGRDIVLQQGAAEVYNHHAKDYLTEVEKNGKFNAILEMLANVNLQNDLGLLKPRGIVVVIGSRGDIKISPRLLMGPETSITGCALPTSTPEEWCEQTSAILKGIEEGWVNPVIDKVYTLEQAKEAHHDIIHSKGAKGNLIVQVS